MFPIVKKIKSKIVPIYLTSSKFVTFLAQMYSLIWSDLKKKYYPRHIFMLHYVHYIVYSTSQVT